MYFTPQDMSTSRKCFMSSFLIVVKNINCVLLVIPHWNEHLSVNVHTMTVFHFIYLVSVLHCWALLFVPKYVPKIHTVKCIHIFNLLICLHPTISKEKKNWFAFIKRIYKYYTVYYQLKCLLGVLPLFSDFLNDPERGRQY